ncbi:hypothetical protein BH09VER1_BH09VER1_49720 [soil metagenome]
MQSIPFVFLQAGLIFLLVDFVSGFVHWIEDSYFSENTPVIGPLVVAPNILHHRSPRHFIKGNFWQRNDTTILPCGAILALGTLAGGFHWQLLLFCLALSLSNELHCWAHRSPQENGRVIAFLHKRGWIQTPAHHAVHHTDPKNRAYCTLTNLLNPVLDRLEIWRRLELAIRAVFGIATRPDPTVDPGRAARNTQREQMKRSSAGL